MLQKTSDINPNIFLAKPYSLSGHSISVSLENLFFSYSENEPKPIKCKFLFLDKDSKILAPTLTLSNCLMLWISLNEFPLAQPT